MAATEGGDGGERGDAAAAGAAGAVGESQEPRAGASELDEVGRVLESATAEKERGAAHYKEQRYAEARECWYKALGELPVRKTGNLTRLALSLHLNLTQVSLTLKDYEEAVKQATEALALDDENSKALYRRGLARDALGQVQAACRDLNKAARLEPRNAEVRRRYEEVKKRALEAEEKEDKPPEHDVAALPRAFIDVAVGDQPPRRMVFALYTDTAPKTAENFRQLCTGEHEGQTAREKPFHYKGSVLHRMIPGLMVQGGDFENANGTGGESIYGRRFPDETFADKHTRRGLLAMANDGPNTNGSNFFVSFAAAEHLDKHHVVFGELVEGWELLDELEKLETNPECRPLAQCTVVECGDLKAEA